MDWMRVLGIIFFISYLFTIIFLEPMGWRTLALGSLTIITQMIIFNQIGKKEAVKFRAEFVEAIEDHILDRINNIGKKKRK